MSEPFPIWITKWCLSQGIEVATGHEIPGNPAWCIVASGRLKNSIMQAGQWHRTKAEAVKEANAALRRATNSARERLEELKSVTFGGEDE